MSTKRKLADADLSEDKNETRNKKQRTVSNIKVYGVTLVEYHDDYKLRGNDPSSSDPPRLFWTKDDAEQYKERELFKRVCEHLREYKGEEEFEEYWTEDGKLDLDAMEDDQDDLVELIEEGEFVPLKFLYQVYTLYIEGTAPSFEPVDN